MNENIILHSLKHFCIIVGVYVIACIAEDGTQCNDVKVNIELG